MVEDNVKELDELNQQVVRQIPDLPLRGKIELEANVSYRESSPVFDIHSHKITTEKEQPIEFNQGETINQEQTTGLDK